MISEKWSFGNILKEQESIDTSELTNSLEFETNERIDENKKQRAEIQKNKESITAFDIKINYLLSTPMQKIPSIYESEPGDLKSRIKELGDQIKLRDNEMANLRTIMNHQEEKIPVRVNTKAINKTKIIHPSSNHLIRWMKETSEKKKEEIMMIFDSNGKHLDRKKVWKLDNSIFKRYGNLHEVNKTIDESEIEELKYILISVGVNDLDVKDHMQVFGEMELIINKTCENYPGIKLVISEITSRKDRRDNEVIKYNRLLWEYAKSYHDIFITSHANLRDPMIHVCRRQTYT